MIYDYRCNACGTLQENVYRRIEERVTNAPQCCGERMQQIITAAPFSYVERKMDYVCPVTNQFVTTKRQRRNIMAEHNLMPAHEIMQTKEQRDAQEQASKDLAEQSKQVPKQLTEQVDNWARKELDGLI